VYGEGYLNVLHESLRLTVPDLSLRGRDEYFDALGQHLQAADLGQKKLKEALDDTVKAWDLITEHLGREGQIAQWQYLKSQYPAHLRSVLR